MTFSSNWEEEKISSSMQTLIDLLIGMFLLFNHAKTS